MHGGLKPEKLQRELVMFIIPMGWMNMVASALAPLTVLLVAGDRVDFRAGVVWTSAVWAIGVAQAVLLIRHRRLKDKSLRGWLLAYAIVEMIDGAAWACFLLVPTRPGEEFAISMLALALLATTTFVCTVAFAGARQIGRSFLWSQWGTFCVLAVWLGIGWQYIACGVIVVVLTSIYLEITHRTLAGAVEARLRLAELAEQLSLSATTDSLTGLMNRHGFMAGLQSMRDSTNAIVLFVDLDGFKAVNDQHGHGRGDDVLADVAKRLQGAVRSEDIVGRLGGDEFVVALRGQDLDAATALADRLTTLLAKPYHGTPTVSITASIGLAKASQSLDSEAVLRRADLAMYQVKSSGGDDHQSYETVQDPS